MEKVNKTSSNVLKIISVVLAIIMWAYVSYQENTEVTHWVKNVPVTIVGSAELDTAGFYVVGTNRTTVDVKLRGERSSLAKVKTDDITAELNISGIRRQGETSLVCDINVGKKNVDVADSRHSTITVSVEEIISTDFAVSTNVVGAPAKGYSVFDPAVSTATVTVRGAESIVNSVSSVATKSVSVNGVSSRNSVSVGLTAFDADGKAVSGVSFEPSTVEVSYNVLKEKTVPLKLSMINVPIDKDISYSPDTVKIYGEAEKVSAVSEIRSEQTDISGVSIGSSLSVRLLLPEGIRLASDGATTDVKFDVEQLTVQDE